MPDSRPLQVILENLPRFLKEFMLWCVWIVRLGDGKGKIPLSPMNGSILRVNWPLEWSRFDDAAVTYQWGRHAGLGVLMRPDDRVIGINLDDCIDENGGLRLWAASIVSGLPTYWEFSPSGHGLRGFVRGTLPPDCPKKMAMAGGRIEAYCEGRFLTVTGHRLPGSAEDVQDCPAHLERFIRLFRTPPPEPSAAPGPVMATMDIQAGDAQRSPIALAVHSTAASAPWPEPERLESELVQVAQFDLALLPTSFQPFARDVAERLQVPWDFLGAATLVALAGITGRRAHVNPKGRDTSWREAGNLWGGIVAEPGTMKTPAIKQALKILQRLEDEAAGQFRDESVQYAREHEAYVARERVWKQDAARRAERGELVEAFAEPEPQEPTCVRYLVNDVTTQKLQTLLAENPGGLLMFRDELAGFFALLDAMGHEGDRAFYLESWSGDQRFTVDRITRGTIRALICLSLFGGIQPPVLRRYLFDTITGSMGEDGLPQRLQVMVYPDPMTAWENVDREPDYAAEEAVANVFRMIASVPVDAFTAKFDGEAQAFFDEWHRNLEHRLLREQTSYLRSHVAKYRGLMPRIALLCHIADSGFAPEIPLRQAQRAAAWCEYLETHARRVYAEGSPRSMAAVLGERLKAGALGQRFTLREIRKKGWGGFDDHKVIRAVLQELVEAGWIRKEPNHPSERGGRPAEAYIVNPRVFET
jgi:hypothetical protein